MSIILDTGITLFGLPDIRSEAVDNDYNLSEPRIYPSEQDAVILVGPQQMAVVTAYFSDSGAPENQIVEVHKILTTSGIPDSGGNGCCPTIHGVPAKKVRSAKLCGWELKDCSPALVIITPGKYQFTPNADSADAIITAQIMPLQEFNRGLDNSIK